MVNNLYDTTFGRTNWAIVLIFLALLAGFRLAFLPGLVCYPLFFALLYWGGFTNFWQHDSPYVKPILYYCLFLTISFIYSYIYHKQNPVSSIGHNYLYYGPLAFFILLKCRPSFEQTEKVLVALCLIYCACYILQYLIYPTVIFNSAESNVDESKFRMRLTGAMLAYILFFYGANKYMIYRNIKFIAIIVLGFIPILIMGFRSLIAATLSCVIVMIPFVVRSTKQTALFAVLGAGLAFAAMQTELVQYKLDEMQRRQDGNQSFDNEDYIRYICLDHYWNYLDNPGEKIIGAGLPTDKSTLYKQEVDYYVEYFGFYWMDLGLVGLAFMIGLPATLLLVYMYLYGMWKARAPEIQYIRFCLFVIFVGSIFTSMELYRPGNLVIATLLFYLEYQYNEEKKFIAS